MCSFPKKFMHRLPRIFFLLTLSLTACFPAFSQPLKREFRGVWIATVKNIDWPYSIESFGGEQKDNLRELIDFHHQKGMNAVIFQVRPSSDAFYNSRFEPWSEWLTGKQGQAPSPLYDPLEVAIEEAHKRGMALHAWFNPYRAVMDWKPNKVLDPTHIARLKPEWMLQYGNNLYFDPGIPEARDYVINVIMDVVQRYDIDAVHFDDYFYPYQITGTEFPDTLSYKTYGASFSDKNEWRRNNVTTFVHMLRDSMLIYKPEVLFGISPFGVWRNQDMDPEGSATRAGQTSYDHLYADILLWLEKGWIDYVAPQIYWSIGYPPAAFDVLAEWWNAHSYGKHVYIGHGPYKVGNNADTNWNNPSEIPNQIRMTRYLPEIQGSIFFSSKRLEENPLGVTDSLTTSLYRYPALLPEIRWVDDEAPKPLPEGLDPASHKEGIVLNWYPPTDSGAKYFAIYRKQGAISPEIVPENLLDIVDPQEPYFLDRDTRFLKRYSYTLTGLDRFHNESAPADFRTQIRWSGGFKGKKVRKKK
ncbi:MAG: family 10 glycosylhydrolase [Bacteroidia bacterium]|nr:family 10 glycosylhydrolase [Bacteroidia bacterium]